MDRDLVTAGHRACGSAVPRGTPVAVVAGILVITYSVRLVYAQGDCELKPDPDVQHILRSLSETQWEGDLSAWCDWFMRSVQLGSRERRRFVEQAVYFLAQSGSQENDYVPMDRIIQMAGLDRRTVVAELIRLSECDDPAISDTATRWLGAFDRCECGYAAEAGHTVDVTIYTRYLQERVASGKAISPKIARSLFRRAPGETVVTMAQITAYFGNPPPPRSAGERRFRSILWAEHVISDTIWKHRHGFLDKDKVEPQAAKELEKLAKRKEWWVRLYVAEIMRQHPAFRRPALIRHLAKDDHPLVREAIEAIVAEQKKPARP